MMMQEQSLHTSQTESNRPVSESVSVCCMIVATGQAAVACCVVGYTLTISAVPMLA